MRAPGLHASDENCGQRVPAPSAPVVRLPDVPLWSHDRREGITMTVHDHLIVDALADDAVRRLARAYGERARARDTDAFCALYHRDVVLFDAFAEQPIAGLDAWPEFGHARGRAPAPVR